MRLQDQSEFVFRQKLFASLKQGGHLMPEAFNPRQANNMSWGAKSPEMLYSFSICKEDFHDFDIQQIEETAINLQQASAHNVGAGFGRMFVRKK